jgi:mono/diheme cytochrome c family protein
MRRTVDSVRALTRRKLAAIAAVVLTTVIGTASADDSSFTSTAGLGSVGGAEIYSHICQGCHMPGAQGAVGAGHYPKLAGDPALVSWQYAAVMVLNGKGAMPAFGLPAAQALQVRAPHLSDAQVADVVNYVRSNFGNHYKARVTPAEVAALPHPAAAPPGD